MSHFNSFSYKGYYESIVTEHDIDFYILLISCNHSILTSCSFAAHLLFICCSFVAHLLLICCSFAVLYCSLATQFWKDFLADFWAGSQNGPQYFSYCLYHFFWDTLYKGPKCDSRIRRKSSFKSDIQSWFSSSELHFKFFLPFVKSYPATCNL